MDCILPIAVEHMAESDMERKKKLDHDIVKTEQDAVDGLAKLQTTLLNRVGCITNMAIPATEPIILNLSSVYQVGCASDCNCPSMVRGHTMSSTPDEQKTRKVLRAPLYSIPRRDRRDQRGTSVTALYRSPRGVSKSASQQVWPFVAIHCRRCTLSYTK